MSRWPKLCLLGTCALTSGLLGPLPSAAAQESADACVRFEKDDQDKGVRYRVASACEKKLACTLSWKLRCEDADGNVIRTQSQSTRFRLPAHGQHSVDASAAECKQGWFIDDVEWQCAEAP